MFPKNLTTIRGLSEDAIRGFLSLAQAIKKDPEKFNTTLKGKTVLQFFVENSTRTKTSFETAVRRMGGVNVSFAPSNSSLAKGESLLDTVRTIQHYGVNAVVIRHSSSGSPDLVADATGLPVVNAGDGSHEHPTQALLDALTLAEEWKSKLSGAQPFSGKTVMILGDTLYSRVARSNIHLLTALGARVVISGPATLKIKNMTLFPKVEYTPFPDAILKDTDAVMALRVQFERQSQGAIPSKEEYRHFWGLTTERLKTMKASAVVFHPGPMNRGIEIDPEVADSDQSRILKQVENGVYARMAVLGTLVGGLKP